MTGPLDESEVASIATSVQRYEPDPDPVIILPKHTEPTIEELPFPTEVFPRTVGKFIYEGAKAIGCPESFIALPLLGCLARAVGNSRVIRLKKTWVEPAIIWAAVVGKSGEGKSPAMQLATKPLTRRQTSKFEDFKEELATYDQDRANYEKDLAKWKKAKTDDKPPWKPAEPVCTRYITGDATIEALAALLNTQYNGVLVIRDELAGWLDGIGEYKAGKGSDKGHWLSCWSGAPVTFDRKTGAIKVMHIQRASVSLVGGIQPGILKRAIGLEHRQDGLCARLLLAMPKPKPVKWTDSVISPMTEGALDVTFEKLLSLEPAANEHGAEEPFPIDLTPDALNLWIAYFNEHRAELIDLDDDLAAAWAKLEAYAARFALIFQLCRWADGTASVDKIDATSIEAGITLSRWFGNEARRVYDLFVESEEDQEQRALVECIEKRGGRVTPRELQAGMRKYRASGAGEAALNELVKAGLARREVTTTSRKQKTEFVLL